MLPWVAIFDGKTSCGNPCVWNSRHIGNLSETVNEIPRASLFELHEVPFGHSTDSPSPICPVGCEVSHVLHFDHVLVGLFSGVIAGSGNTKRIMRASAVQLGRISNVQADGMLSPQRCDFEK